MPEPSTLPPLSLYIHLPWCVQKCPYCDFNSHALRDNLPEELYINALIDEVAGHLPLINARSISSIFFGGGTPSLFSGKAIGRLLDSIKQQAKLAKDAEITLEANPGTIDMQHFAAFRAAGINRLSLGIQSFQNEQLKKLGRIHDSQSAARAIGLAKSEGFDNFNLDIMYGLPQQKLEEALADIHSALEHRPTHFSWYQLTLEPNTLFYQQPPTLPEDEALWEIQEQGQALIKDHGFDQYEVSAYSHGLERQCRHNLNYWQFGDYLGIGAGAHSKLSRLDDHKQLIVSRFSQVKHPKDYLNPEKRRCAPQILLPDDLIFEFMLNGLRLTDGISVELFEQRTGLPHSAIAEKLQEARKLGLIDCKNQQIKPTERGKHLLNDLISLFLK